MNVPGKTMSPSLQGKVSPYVRWEPNDDNSAGIGTFPNKQILLNYRYFCSNLSGVQEQTHRRVGNTEVLVDLVSFVLEPIVSFPVLSMVAVAQGYSVPCVIARLRR